MFSLNLRERVCVLKNQRERGISCGSFGRAKEKGRKKFPKKWGEKLVVSEGKSWRLEKIGFDWRDMEKKLTLLQTVATAGVFSAISFWYGFMFGRESSRKELSQLIEDLRNGNPSSSCSVSSSQS